MKSFRSFRLSAIAAAMVLAVPAAHAADVAQPSIAKMSVSGLSTAKGFDRFIVTYRNGTTEHLDRSAALQNVKAAVGRANRSAFSVPVSASYQRKLAIGSDLVRTSRKLNASEASALMQQIAADPAVAHVEPDVMMRAVRDIAAPTNVTPQTFTPDDTYYAKYQWHFSNATGGANINNAWDIADGNGVTVAVLDTGITQHPDIDLSLADAGYDFIIDAFVSGRSADGRVPGGWDNGDWTTGDTYAQCRNAGDPGENSSWHGTHVSGTIAELTNNGTGMAGIAYKAKVLPVRVLGHCGGYTSDIADAIVWASGGHVDGVPDNTHPAQVISMSLGGGGNCTADSVTGQAIAGAISRGASVVVAAGNNNADVANYSPASCPGVIAVASNGITGKRAFYSNYGSGVLISAPGGGVYTNDDPNTGTQANPEGFVWSAINSGTTVPANATYGGMAGTSQATPHVSGTIAMILGATQQAGLPTPTPAQIKNLLTSTARRFPATIDKPIGAGIVNAFAAVNKALGNDTGNEPVVALTKGVLLGGQSGGTGASILYSIDVPAGARSLNIRTLGGTGDVSLFVKAGSAPASDGGNADFRSVKPGNSEAVVVAQPQTTTYYIRVLAVQAFDKVSVLATYTQ
ncbi:serine protease [Dyella sp. OK004]|uniref:S8 family peptidase n=1 Tax=Dyella sp. OK004 TaxID=1855292 RepID=UPI0008EA40F7|nr:S8 family peptidase [Dyella sp. OK004]SFR88803.1 serine protease [Dyella sp. OK004]